VPVQFLSDEWVEELKQRLNASESFRENAGDAEATLQQVISGGPEGERRYWIIIEEGRIEMGPGEVEHPDATITQDYDTAAGLARGEVSPVSAFMTGRLKINGSMMLIMQLQGAISELPKAMDEMDIDY
jgi:putative sterol carrier protein